ncbi:MAG: hypothetical protein R2867_26700 [Caldilineaceae bacterium]
MAAPLPNYKPAKRAFRRTEDPFSIGQQFPSEDRPFSPTPQSTPYLMPFLGQEHKQGASHQHQSYISIPCDLVFQVQTNWALPNAFINDNIPWTTACQ